VDSNYLLTEDSGSFTVNFDGEQPSSFDLYRGSNYANQFCVLSTSELIVPGNMKYAYTYNDATRPLGGPQVAQQIGTIGNSSYVPVTGLVPASDYETAGIAALRGTSSSSVVRHGIYVSLGNTFGPFLTWFSVPGSFKIDQNANNYKADGAGKLYYAITKHKSYPSSVSKVGALSYADKTKLSDILLFLGRTYLSDPSTTCGLDNSVNAIFTSQVLDTAPSGDTSVPSNPSTDPSLIHGRCNLFFTTPFV
jgi:hypothetical protein